MENMHHDIPQISGTTESREPAPNAMQLAAQQAYDGPQLREAVAVVDNSRAVQQLFPDDGSKQNSAYRIIMHDQQIQGYPVVQYTDLNRFSDAETQKIDKYEDTYKPSVDLAKVHNEQAELAKMGFPNLSHH